MEKKLTNRHSSCGSKLTFRAIMISMLFLFLGTYTASASPSYSQATQLRLKTENKTVKQVLSEIEKSSEFIFFYSDKALNLNQKVNVANVNGNISQVLDKVLDKNAVGYKVEDRQVVLYSLNHGKDARNLESASPQQAKKTIKGQVVDAKGETLIGVSVAVKGTNSGTLTDMDGNFTLAVSASNVALQFSYVGFATQVVNATAGNTIKVVLKENAKQLDEVVVTALGIKREKKALGYAMQEVKGDKILGSRESNVANALTGQVAGLQVIRSSNGPAGSSKINLRGNNSLTGKNQPLIVVDGVPIDNFVGASNNDYWNPSPDMGNGLSDINPDDIESMSVLKGASAAALYGSRAGNGVILITTKSGQKQKGLGVTVSSTVGLETIFMRPKFQSSFGQGTDGAYNARSGSSWGPEIAGQSVTNWDGKAINMAAYDNVSNYFDKPGVSLTESVAFQQAYEKTSVYSSITRLDDKSIIPGAKLNRTNMMLHTVTKFGAGDKWTFDAKMQYSNTAATNRPLNGRNDSNSFMAMYLLPRSMDIRGFSSEKKEDGNMLWYPGGGNQMNPYWMKNNSLATDSRDRFLMNGSLNYKFNEYLNVEVKAGRDMYTTTTESKLYALSPLSKTGRYSFGKSTFYENNLSALFTAKKDNIVSKLGGSAQIGGNLMKTESASINASAGELLAPNLFSINNASNGKPTVSDGFSAKKINSLYGTAQLNWDGWAFIDGTFRNDWTSTLSKEHRSFFYPSVNVSWVITDMMSKMDFNVPSWFTFAKVRVSHAEVGNDMQPYQLYNTYKLDNDPNGQPVAKTDKTLYNPNVRNELIKSSEVGAELRFFNNRLGLDVAWYKSNATNQLLNLAMDPLSGYNNRKINAGNIQNQGMEFMLNAHILDNPKSLSWNLTINSSFNRNKIVSLAPDLGISKYDLGTFEDLKITSVEGSLYGDIYGTTFQRVKDGPNAGKLLLDEKGLPQKSADQSFLGNQQASSLLGITNVFTYKGFNLGFLIDARFGGKVYSGTNQAMQTSGTSAETVVNGKRESFIVDGVIADKNGGYVQNTIATTPQKYWGAVAGNGNLGIAEANIYDASNIRLRNIQFGYTFDRKMLAKTPFQSVKLGVTCTNVWMISSHLKGVDPESVYATGTNAVGFEYGSAPTNRSYLFNISLGF